MYVSFLGLTTFWRSGVLTLELGMVVWYSSWNGNFVFRLMYIFLDMCSKVTSFFSVDASSWFEAVWLSEFPSLFSFPCAGWIWVCSQLVLYVENTAATVRQGFKGTVCDIISGQPATMNRPPIRLSLNWLGCVTCWLIKLSSKWLIQCVERDEP